MRARRKSWGWRVWPLLAVAMLLSGQWGADRSTPALAEHDAGPDVGALAERLLTPPFAENGTGPVDTRLVVGDVPSGMPSPFPVPDGGRVLGGVARSTSGRLLSADAAIDAPGAPSELRRFYDQTLPQMGWTPAPQWDSAPPSGLQSASPVQTAAYCESPSGPWVWLSLTPVDGGAPTDIRVHLEPVNPGPCAPRPATPPGPPTLDMVPALTAPDGAALIRTGGSADMQRSSAEGYVVTSASSADLETSLARQLEAAGWTRQTGQSQGAVAWSTWKLPQQGDWQGFLTVFDGPGVNRRDVYVRVESGAPSFAWPGTS